MSSFKETLQNRFPEATDAEITRFITAYGKGKPDEKKNQEAITTRLEEHMEWRKNHGLWGEAAENGDTDASVWEAAVKQAWDFEESIAGESNGADASPPSRESINQLVFFHKSEADGKAIVDTNGSRVVHLLSGRINKEAASADVYANCVANYFDRHLSRNDTEKVTIMIDVRSGTGWPNTPAIKMVGFVRTVVRVFEFNFPELVRKFVVFPLPFIAKGIFQTIKMLLDATTASKIALATGSALADSPLPKKDLVDYIDESVLDQTEKARLSYFSEVEEKSSGWFF